MRAETPNKKETHARSHIHPFPAINLNELSKNSKKREEEVARKGNIKKVKKGNVKMVKRKERTHASYWLLDELRANRTTVTIEIFS